MPDDQARKVAFRLRLMLLQQDAEFMSAAGICTETKQIEDRFGIRLRHALCDHPDFTLSVDVWGEETPY